MDVLKVSGYQFIKDKLKKMSSVFVNLREVNLGLRWPIHQLKP
jgi:hypothetical protein